jgi:hypothetical protein
MVNVGAPSPAVVTKAKPLPEDEVFAVHERLVRAAETAGYTFFFLDPERLEAFPIGEAATPLQRTLLSAIQRVRPARTRLLRARRIETAAEREQAIHDAWQKNQCTRSGASQKLGGCLGSRRRGAPPPSPNLCDGAQALCRRKQPEAEFAWRKPTVPVTVNVEELAPTLDHRLRDKAMAKTRSALSEVRAAADYFERHAAKVEWAIRVMRHDEVPERTAAKRLKELAREIQDVLEQTDRFDDYPDIHTASDWEAALFRHWGRPSERRLFWEGRRAMAARKRRPGRDRRGGEQG